MLYDDEFPGKPNYFLRDAKAYSEQNPYFIHQITMMTYKTQYLIVIYFDFRIFFDRMV